MRGAPAQAFAAVLMLLGVAIVVRTLALGGGALAVGVLMGALLFAAGAGRLYVERRR